MKDNKLSFQKIYIMLYLYLKLNKIYQFKKKLILAIFVLSFMQAEEELCLELPELSSSDEDNSWPHEIIMVYDIGTISLQFYAYYLYLLIRNPADLI